VESGAALAGAALLGAYGVVPPTPAKAYSTIAPAITMSAMTATSGPIPPRAGRGRSMATLFKAVTSLFLTDGKGRWTARDPIVLATIV
jgi:hypothetical protein